MFKRLGLLLLLLILLGVGCSMALSKKMPMAIDENADALANKMLSSLNKDAWDTLAYLQWEFFRGEHKYLWDKQANIANIQWKDNEVIMDLNTLEAKVMQDGQVVTKDADKIREKAWSYWCNDSFWMFAPFKVFDEGVERTVVASDEAPYALKVSYESGGVTPGDAYVWLLDEDYIPYAWRMYVQILPVKGLYTGWSNYKSIGGALLAIDHGSKIMNLQMKNVKGGDTIDSIDAKSSSFQIN